MKTLIEAYLKDKENSWAQSTLKSEASRLAKIADLIAQGPKKLHEGLLAQGKEPYTIQTTFIRVICFADWMVANGHAPTNEFAIFKDKNANFFKQAYQTEKLEVTEEQARAAIADIKHETIRALAKNMLDAGLRASEALQPTVDGTVLGKGSKRRKVFTTEQVTDLSNVNYKKLYYELKKVGLKPHSLRKLAATRASRNGALPEDMCAIFGWSKFETASKYLQAAKDEVLENLLGVMRDGDKVKV
jgi:integrase